MFSGCQSTFMPYIIYSFHSFYFPQLETKASDVMQSISSLRTRRECPTDGLQTSHCRLCSFPSRAQSCSIPQHTQSPQGASRGVVSRRHVHRATNIKKTRHVCSGTCCSTPSWNTRDGKCNGCKERTTRHPKHEQT